MADLLVDTDVFVDHLRGERELRRGEDVLAYSAITRAELFAGSTGDDEQVAALLAPFVEIDVDRDIAEHAGRLRRQSQIPLPDALIAATALHHRLELMTRHVGNFQSIGGLRLHEP